jgi:protein required for attachment to host cells
MPARAADSAAITQERNMGTTWILCANRSRARLFEVQAHSDTPSEVADFANPAARTHERDLRSDASGRLYGKGERNQGHAADPSQSQADHETERFAESLRDYLIAAHAGQRFAQLWIAAAPAFLGVLRHKLPKDIHRLVELEVPKDFTAEQAPGMFRHIMSEREAHLRKDETASG